MGVFSAFFGCRGATGFKASTSLRPVRKIFRPVVLSSSCRREKFAQRAHNTPISAFLGVLGEFFRGSAAVGAVLGELFRARRRHSVSTAHRHRAQVDAVSARTAGPIRPLKRGDQGPYDGITAKRSVVIIAQ